jgi:hypothetical protein
MGAFIGERVPRGIGNNFLQSFVLTLRIYGINLGDAGWYVREAAIRCVVRVIEEETRRFVL